MTAADLRVLSPFLILGLAALLLLCAISIRRSHLVAASICVAGLAAAGLSVPLAAREAPRRLAPLLVIDDFGLFFVTLMLAASLAVALLAQGFLGGQDERPEELYVLLLLAGLGASLLVVSTHFASLFLALEILSVSLYALIAYLRSAEGPIEAGEKYLILAGASSAFLLFGMALLYTETGTLTLDRAASLAGEARLDGGVMTVGVALLLGGIAFKLALVPFHMWAPDVYQGAPPPVAALVATVSKGALLAVLLRYFPDLRARGEILLALSLLAAASMVAGNMLALLQSNLKRLLAYSSVAHLGYAVVALIAGGELAVQAVTFYLVAYFVTILSAFGVLSVLPGAGEDAETVAAYRGLCWRQPPLGALLLLSLLSLAGLPLTAGFIAKLYVITAGVGAGMWALVLVLAASSAIGIYYYLRVVGVLLAKPDDVAPSLPASLTPAGVVLLSVLGLLMVGLGVYPGPVQHVLPTSPVARSAEIDETPRTAGGTRPEGAH